MNLIIIIVKTFLGTSTPLVMLINDKITLVDGFIK